MNKSKSKLSPFSALKQSSPLRNLRPPQRDESPKEGPITRSRTASSRPRKMDEADKPEASSRKRVEKSEERTSKEFTNRPYNHRRSKIVTHAKDSEVRTKDQTKYSDYRRRHSEYRPRDSTQFHFQLKESPKKDSKSKNDPNPGSIFPRRSSAMSYADLHMFDPTVPPPNFSKPLPDFSGNTVNVPPPPISGTSKFSQPGPSKASTFRFELPQETFPVTSKASTSKLSQKPAGDGKSAQEILKEFLKKRGYSTQKRPKPTPTPDDDAMEVEEGPKMNIALAQAILEQCRVIEEKISKLRAHMVAEVDTIPDYEWEMKSQQMTIYRMEICEILDPILAPGAIEMLQERLKARQAKREWFHKKNAVYRSQKQMEKERRIRTKAFIDEWNEKLRQMEDEKRDKELEKQAAKELLVDVTKRIRETKKFIEIFGRLKQLSLVRIVADGQNTGAPAEDFMKKMDELQAVWEDLLVEYQEEKITLDTILDRRTSHVPLPPEPKSIQAQWLETIFGADSIYDDNNPLLIAERDISNFFHIRALWDRCIVPDGAPPDMGSSIPLFWALPSRNSTSQWWPYLQKNSN
ncbi:uncharacterized protein LOC129802364 [Phlebotomus papatasi]|uniref:uncharacterized protein LOC129802364 n=1 Tax=Phlebotomus papatasi TaxID=29031 RepID=UPI002483DDF6|nr:uncharacterized protein LOC129802364 [Phlebotomus papatasi]